MLKFKFDFCIFSSKNEFKNHHTQKIGEFHVLFASSIDDPQHPTRQLWPKLRTLDMTSTKTRGHISAKRTFNLKITYP